MQKYLILVPLAMLVIVAILSVAGLGSTVFGDGRIGGDPSTTLYYDAGGHPCVYANGTAYDEAGQVIQVGGLDAAWSGTWAAWKNTTLSFGTNYPLYWDQSAEQPIPWERNGETNVGGQTFDVNQSMGLIALVIALMAMAVVVGLRVLGSGTSNSLVLVLGTAYLGVWGIFSVLSLPLITSIPNFGNFFYFILTIMYTLGIVWSFQGTGGTD